MAERANMDIRMAMKEAGIKQWQIADELGVQEATISRHMRHELPEDEAHKILSIIWKLKIKNQEVNKMKTIVTETKVYEVGDIVELNGAVRDCVHGMILQVSDGNNPSYKILTNVGSAVTVKTANMDSVVYVGHVDMSEWETVVKADVEKQLEIDREENRKAVEAEAEELRERRRNFAENYRKQYGRTPNGYDCENMGIEVVFNEETGKYEISKSKDAAYPVKVNGSYVSDGWSWGDSDGD